MDTQTTIIALMFLATGLVLLATAYVVGHERGFEKGLRKQLSKLITDHYKRDDGHKYGPTTTEDEGDVVIEVQNGEDDFDQELVGK